MFSEERTMAAEERGVSQMFHFLLLFFIFFLKFHVTIDKSGNRMHLDRSYELSSKLMVSPSGAETPVF